MRCYLLMSQLFMLTGLFNNTHFIQTLLRITEPLLFFPTHHHTSTFIGDQRSSYSWNPLIYGFKYKANADAGWRANTPIIIKTKLSVSTAADRRLWGQFPKDGGRVKLFSILLSALFKLRSITASVKPLLMMCQTYRDEALTDGEKTSSFSWTLSRNESYQRKQWGQGWTVWRCVLTLTGFSFIFSFFFFF